LYISNNLCSHIILDRSNEARYIDVANHEPKEACTLQRK